MKRTVSTMEREAGGLVNTSVRVHEGFRYTLSLNPHSILLQQWCCYPPPTNEETGSMSISSLLNSWVGPTLPFLQTLPCLCSTWLATSQNSDELSCKELRMQSPTPYLFHRDLGFFHNPLHILICWCVWPHFLKHTLLRNALRVCFCLPVSFAVTLILGSR